MPPPPRPAGGRRQNDRARLRWDAECDTAAVSPGTCSAILAALKRASAAVEAGLALRRPLTMKLSATAGGAGRDVHVLAAASVPGWFDGARGRVPQALARQAEEEPPDAGRWDAMVTVAMPPEGFFFEGDPTVAGESRPNFDAVLHHELLHAFGLATSLAPAFGTGALATAPVTNGTRFVSFSQPNAFDNFLVDSSTGTPLSRLWADVASFRTEDADHATAFRTSRAYASAAELYDLATTPERVAFQSPTGTRIILDTSSKPFIPGRSLSHLSSTSNPSELLLLPTAPRGPLPESMLANTTAGRVIRLSPAATAMLRAIGWTPCEDDPAACVGSAAAAPPPAAASSGLPTWAIGVIAAAGVLFVAALAGGLFLMRRRRAAKPVEEDEEKDAKVPTSPAPSRSKVGPDEPPAAPMPDRTSTPAPRTSTPAPRPGTPASASRAATPAPINPSPSPSPASGRATPTTLSRTPSASPAPHARSASASSHRSMSAAWDAAFAQPAKMQRTDSSGSDAALIPIDPRLPQGDFRALASASLPMSRTERLRAAEGSGSVPLRKPAAPGKLVRTQSYASERGAARADSFASAGSRSRASSFSSDGGDGIGVQPQFAVRPESLSGMPSRSSSPALARPPVVRSTSYSTDPAKERTSTASRAPRTRGASASSRTRESPLLALAAKPPAFSEVASRSLPMPGSRLAEPDSDSDSDSDSEGGYYVVPENVTGARPATSSMDGRASPSPRSRTASQTSRTSSPPSSPPPSSQTSPRHPKPAFVIPLPDRIPLPERAAGPTPNYTPPRASPGAGRRTPGFALELPRGSPGQGKMMRPSPLRPAEEGGDYFSLAVAPEEESG
ncbi:hypothetical protein DFJ74DRAFT_733085 [Hyaloraphidium curvatum]|nr:hypothetical protein DFJ74DRAFT_733085 [Hyaloraphidium curvatum]